ncbi:MAG TPA: T9SS type A sorting domain-containing protein [Vicingaceae bacterium]
MYKKIIILIIILLTALIGFSQTALPVSRTTWSAGAPLGWTDSGTGTYTSSFACTTTDMGQLNSSGDFYQVFFSGTPNLLTFKLKSASMDAASFCLVEESPDGLVWSTLGTYGPGNTTFTDCDDISLALTSTTRYVRWTYTKSAGNCGLDDVNITELITCSPSSEPTVNSSAINFSNIGCYAMDLNWTSGNGANRIVVASISPISGTPTDQTNYIANAVFGSGSTIASGEFVVYNGSGNTVTITGLSTNTTYYFAIFEYNGTNSNCDENYLTMSFLTGNQLTATCTCSEITGILVDACGGTIEGINEFFTFTNGDDALYMDSLTVNFPNGGAFCNSGCGTQTWTTNPNYVDSLNSWANCPGLFVEADPIPSGADVVVFTGANPTFNFDFSGLCGTGPYYAVFANNTNTSGRFANYNATCSIRYLSVDFGSDCIDTVGYDRCLLSSTDGAYVAFDAEGNPTYENDGCTPTALLPIELVEFSGEIYDDNSNMLKWVTLTEINNDYFTLERSADAINFETIAIVTGSGNSSIILNYNFIDVFPKEQISTYYYRLKQTDFDGKSEYFNMVAISRKKDNQLSVFAYDNQLTIQSEESYILQLLDLTGRVVYNSESQKNNIDLSFLSKGIYIYRIEFSNIILSDKIIVQ